MILSGYTDNYSILLGEESLGMSPGALPSRGLVFQLVCFHRYWTYNSKCTVRPKMESCFQDRACFLLHPSSSPNRCLSLVSPPSPKPSASPVSTTTWLTASSHLFPAPHQPSKGTKWASWLPPSTPALLSLFSTQKTLYWILIHTP